jgi:type VI secretion system protein
MLTLTIENASSLASGDPTRIELDRRGVVIGRAPHADWTLSDPENFVSSEHCEIDYREGHYLLTDRSTNGTFVNGARDRVAPEGHMLADGDLIAIGHYQVRVGLPATAAAMGSAVVAGPRWAGTGGVAAAAGRVDDRFGLPRARPIFEETDDPMLGSFAPPPAPAATQRDPFGLGGGAAPLFAPQPASAPSADVPPSATAWPPAPSAAVDAWSRIATPPPAAPPFAPAPAATANAWSKLYQTADFQANASVTPAPISLEPPSIPVMPIAAIAEIALPVAPSPASPLDDGSYRAFLEAAGLQPRDLDGQAPATILAAAGHLLRQTADGLIRLLDARARMRQQFGVQQRTEFRPSGNNPLKWTRQPEQALRQLLGQPDRGFQNGNDAVRSTFVDLQAHEFAMIAAMHDALKATMERFGPNAIRARAHKATGLGRLLPGAQEAQLWAAYERDYLSLADESEAAYLDLFAKYFRSAYEQALSQRTS